MVFDDVKVNEKFYKNMHMMPVFLFVSDNKKLMIVELLNRSSSCVQGKVIRQVQMILPKRCAELGSHDLDVKLIFMLNTLVMELQLQMRDITMPM
jgi:hypothetical protein